MRVPRCLSDDMIGEWKGEKDTGVQPSGSRGETDGQTETSRHTQKDKKEVDRERQVDRAGMEKPGPPKPSGHPWMEQTVVHGGEGGPRTG